MTEWVRVRMPNGSHISLPAREAAQLGLKPLRRPALSRAGTPLPPKRRVPSRTATSATPTPDEAPASAETSKED